MSIPAVHYPWAGLDFMIDEDDRPVLLEANRSSHMLWEYVGLYGDEKPFQYVANWMNEADGPPCLLWRRSDPEPEATEDACWIGAHLAKHLGREPLIALVEDNQDERPLLRTRDGQWVRPGSLFRWWYPLPWTHERSGVRVVNPNAAWVIVRDKLDCYNHLCDGRHFRIPRSFAIDDDRDVRALLDRHPEVFRRGYVLKPRTGFGGRGVWVRNPGAAIGSIPPGYLLSERIVPDPAGGEYWDVRAFVMAGRYCGGVQRTSPQPVTNVFQGGIASRLDDALSARLEAAALEAVERIDRAAAGVHVLPEPPTTPLTRVEW